MNVSEPEVGLTEFAGRGMLRPSLLSPVSAPLTLADPASRMVCCLGLEKKLCSKGWPVYCSKCGAQMADGALFCSACGQAFSTAAPARPIVPHTVAPAPSVDYGGFWLRFLAYLIDGAVIMLGIMVVGIPLIFLTGLGTLLSQIHPEEDFNDAGFWLIMAVIFSLVTVGAAVTWLYHALMESSEWQATVGKKALDLVVTDMAGRRVSFWRATGRHFAKIVSNMIYPFGHIMAGFTAQKQALHDMIAGCLILRRNT